MTNYGNRRHPNDYMADTLRRAWENGLQIDGCEYFIAEFTRPDNPKRKQRVGILVHLEGTDYAADWPPLSLAAQVAGIAYRVFELRQKHRARLCADPQMTVVTADPRDWRDWIGAEELLYDKGGRWNLWLLAPEQGGRSI